MHFAVVTLGFTLGAATLSLTAPTSGHDHGNLVANSEATLPDTKLKSRERLPTFTKRDGDNGNSTSTGSAGGDEGNGDGGEEKLPKGLHNFVMIL